MLDKLTVTKFVARNVARAGTAKIVKDIITNNVTIETKIEKITVATASLVIGWMAKDKVGEYVNTEIDSFVNMWNERKAEPQKEELPIEA